MKQPVNYGGQAVIEGVMMRGPRFFALACRRANGEIVEIGENVESFIQKWKWLHRPFLRGTLALIDSMALGSKALRYSANVALLDAPDAKKESEKPAEPGHHDASATEFTRETHLAIGADTELMPIPAGPADPRQLKSVNDIAIAGTMILSLALGVGLFMLLPSLLANLTRPISASHVWLNVVEGIVRLGLFLGYITLIGRMEEIRRIFQYHGAEHKTINAYEAGAELTPETVQTFSRIHPRCGTSFILIVLIVATLAHTVMGWPVWYLRLLSRILVLPLVAGISYEIIRYAGQNRDKTWLQNLLMPGLKTQYLTTREPTLDQVEVAIRALNIVLEKDGGLEYKDESAAAPEHK
ncbi:MAG: DUF1385 domain-containing protein [Armatimonadetes bacterium]|nr:DUF1385 domain-containing protein [Armatimonadota bacterium]